MISPQWVEGLSVGVPRMDRQHRRMVELVNQVIAALEQGDDGAADHALAALTAHARHHFAAEEALIAACGVPAAECDAHRAEHRLLLGEVEALRRLDGDWPDRENAIALLSKWAMRHIIEHDLAYRPYAIGHPAAEET
ncbi:bacteriohemerythrin [Phaeospirillum tilakii]|uniref:Bacteriohemerythrin n=1 Tax=Phaeospirillum tilakii TaxID=741673 RepID=A0ABW5CAZ2_9PROT